MSDYRKMWDAATKEGDRHMRHYGGMEWSKEDMIAAWWELSIQYEKERMTMNRQLEGTGQVRAAAGNETG